MAPWEAASETLWKVVERRDSSMVIVPLLISMLRRSRALMLEERTMSIE